MSRLAIVVQFQVKPERTADFLAHISEHARLTKQEEPACLQFDVLRPQDAPDRVVLVEMYRDQAGLDAHRANPRLKLVQQAYAAMIESRAATVCTVG